MAEDRRLGALYWIDHFVVPTKDLDRWVEFNANVLGATAKWGGASPPGQARVAEFLMVTPGCHHAAFAQSEPLRSEGGLAQGLPRYGFYIRADDIDEHLRRLDRFHVPHTDPIRTSAEGQEGTVIYFKDPDENQLELWAPVHMPDGAMDGCGPLKIGRISSATYASRDLARTADFYIRYCGIDPAYSADIPKDTLAFTMLGGSRIAFKEVEVLSKRTGGSTLYRGLHSAFVVRDEDFMPAYRRVWDELQEWEYDQLEGPPTVDPGTLSARTGMHGSAAGRKWKQLYGRGDQIYDWDTNSFHFVGGVSQSPTMATYEGRYMDDYVEAFMKEREGSRQ